MRLVAVLLAVACGGIALGDEAVIFLPTELAARVEGGTRSGLTVALEPRSEGAVASVTETVQALPSAPAYPLAGPERCGDPEALEVPPSFSPPPVLARLRGHDVSAFDVFVEVIDLVSQRITLDENDLGAQDGVSVLTRMRGRCSGRANAAIGLLRTVGIPARVVHGLVLGTNGARWHRWGEAWLGDAGWIAFDPGVAVGLVSVRYLPLRGAGEGPSLNGVRVERMSERGFLALPVRGGVRVLPVGGVTLHCVAPGGDPSISALLVGPDGSRWARQGRGEVVFAGMLPGRYRIVWRGSGPPSALTLELGAAPQVQVALSGSGEAGS
jgi:hypothetical protein